MCLFLNSLRVGGRKSWSWFFLGAKREVVEHVQLNNVKKPSGLSLLKVQEKLKVIRKTWLQFFFGPWGEVYLYFKLLLTVEDLPPTWIAGFMGGQTPHKTSEARIPKHEVVVSSPQIILAGLLVLGTSDTVQIRSFADELSWFLLAWNYWVARSQGKFPKYMCIHTLLKGTCPLLFGTFEDDFRLQWWDMCLFRW